MHYSILNKFLIILFAFFSCAQGYLCAQGYRLPKNQKSEKIKFQLLNNLIIIPIQVNGTPLSFVLDSGVGKPILFNLSDQDSVQFNNVSEVTINGLGQGEAINALSSKNNTFQLGSAANRSQELFLVMDAGINFSPTLGIPVHGIIGFDLFRDFVVEIDYIKRVLKLHDPNRYQHKKKSKIEILDLAIVGRKAYLNAEIALQNDKFIAVKMLLDTGSSDAIWLFENDSILLPKKYYDDFLGKGLAGDIYGKRTKVEKVKIGSHVLSDAKAAFPDMLNFEAVINFRDRNGSLGGELLKRFNIVFDYPNSKIAIKKNRNFRLPFQYNISGINLQHAGVRYISERIDSGNMAVTKENTTYGNVQLMLAGATRLSLVPEIIVSGIRAGSPAHSSGLKEGDVILAVNGRKIHRYKLQEILQMLNEKKEKRVKVLVGRANQDLLFSFILKDLFK